MLLIDSIPVTDLLELEEAAAAAVPYEGVSVPSAAYQQQPEPHIASSLLSTNSLLKSTVCFTSSCFRNRAAVSLF